MNLKKYLKGAPYKGFPYSRQDTDYLLDEDSADAWWTAEPSSGNAVTDDYPGGSSSADTLSLGNTLFGGIEQAQDQDWFRLTLVASTNYTLDLQAVAQQLSALSDPYLSLYDGAGRLVAQDDDGGAGADSRLLFRPSATGAYYVVASGNSGATGGYALTVNPAASPITDDYAGGTATTGSFSAGGAVSGVVEQARDQDWFAISLDQACKYVFSLQGEPSRATWSGANSFDPYLTVYDSLGRVVAHNDDTGGGLDARLSFQPVSGGVYYLSASGYGDNTGGYVLQASVDNGPDDYAGNPTTQGSLTTGNRVQAVIESAQDQDWFKVSLDPTVLYTFDLRGAGGANHWGLGLGSSYTYLCLYDSAGNCLGRDSGQANGAARRLVYQPSLGGVYYIAALSHGGYTGGYALSSSGVVVDDYAANPGSTGALAVQGMASGTIQSSTDQDWFSIDLEQGQVYHFTLTGGAAGGGGLNAPGLSLYDSGGQKLKSTKAGTPGNLVAIDFSCAASGAYYLAAAAYFNNQGSYALASFRDDYAGASNTAGTIAANGESLTGTIEFADDADWFGISLSVGNAYLFNLQGAASPGGPLAEAVLKLYDDTGALLASGAAGALSSLSRWPKRDGWYYLSAAGATSADQGTYALEATSWLDDYSADTATRGELNVGGTTSGSIETVGDDDWFAISLAAGASYVFSLRAAGDLDLRLNVRDAAGDMIPGDPNLSAITPSSHKTILSPAAGGVYYLDVQSGGLLGSYSLAADSDVAGTTATTASLTVGGSAISGNLDLDADTDWFRVSLTAGSSYYFGLNSSGELNDRLYLRNSTGAQIQDHYLFESSASSYRLLYSPTASGSYYLEVQGGNAGAYALSAGTEVAENTSTTASLTIGAPAITGSIDINGDWDWFRVSLTAGSSYAFGLDSAGDLNYRLYLHNSTGAQIQDHYIFESSASSYRLVYSAAASGLYYLEVQGGAAGAYTLSAGTEVAENTSTTASLTIGAPAITGSIDINGDFDWFRVSLTAGSSYFFSLNSAGDLNYRLYLHNSTGGYIQDHYLFESSANSYGLLYSAAASGLYYLEVQGGNAGAYTLSASKDVAESTSTAASLTIGASAVSGSIEVSGDSDWYRVSLQTGMAYSFSTSSADTSYCPRITLRNAAGASVTGFYFTTTGDHGSGSFIPTAGGIYYLDVTGTGWAGAYALTTTSRTDQADSIATTANLTIGAPAISGTLDTDSDADWYRVTLQAGTVYHFTLDSSALFYPRITLRNSAGTGMWDPSALITTSSHGYDLVLMPTAGGVYYLDIQNNGHTGAYSLIGTSKSDVAGSISTTASLTIGAPALTGTIDTSSDSDWYRVSLHTGMAYNFTLDAPGSFPPTITLRNSVGADMSFGSPLISGNGSNKVGFIPSANGVYYLDVTCRGDTGDYSLSGTSLPDQAGDTSTTASLTSGAPAITGAIDMYSDSDWYRVSLQTGLAYYFNLTALGPNLNPPGIALHDATGAFLSEYSVAYDNVNETGVFVPSANGIYYLETRYCPGIYSLSASSVVELPGNTSTTASLTIGAPALGGTLDGERDSGDWYRTSLAAGTTYYFRVAAGGTTLHPQLWLMDATGQSVSYGIVRGTASTILYDATASGVYYLDVGGGDRFGAYDLSGVTEVVPTFTIGAPSLTSTIDLPGDFDWYRVSLAAETVYTFSLTTWDGLEDGLISLSGGGRGLSFTSGDHGGSGIFFTDTDGVFNLGVCSSASTGAYSLTGTVTGTDAAGSTSTSASLTIGGPSLTGATDMIGDSDWYRVNLTAGSSYFFSVATSGGQNSPAMTFFDASGASVWGFKSPTDSSGVFTATVGGTYYLCVTDRYNRTGSYVLSGYTDVAGSTSTTASLTIGAPALTGTCEGSGDSDWYRVSLAAGISYAFTLEGLIYPSMEMRDSSGAYLSVFQPSRHPYENSSCGVFTPATDGVYYVIPAGSGSTYTLSGYTEVAGSTSTTASLTTGAPALSSTLECWNDSDWYLVSLTAGTLYSFDLSGHTVGGGNLLGRLAVYDASGSQIATAQGRDFVGNSQLTYSPTISGAYYLSAAGVGYSYDYGTYKLNAYLDDYAAGTGTTGALSVPTDTTHVSVSGNIDCDGDRDWFQVSMLAGHDYHFDLTGSGASPLGDPYLYLFDGTGYYVLGQDDNSGGGSAAHLDYSCTASGAYFVGAASNGNQGTGAYTLTGWDPPTPGYVFSEDSGLSSNLNTTLNQVEAAGSQAVLDIMAAAATASASAPSGAANYSLVSGSPVTPDQTAGSPSDATGGSTSGAPAPGGQEVGASATSSTPATSATSCPDSGAGVTGAAMMAAGSDTATPTLVNTSAADNSAALAVPH